MRTCPASMRRTCWQCTCTCATEPPNVTPCKSEHNTNSPQRLNLAVLDPLHQHYDALGGVSALAVLIDAAERVLVQTAPKKDKCEPRCDIAPCRAFGGEGLRTLGTAAWGNAATQQQWLLGPLVLRPCPPRPGRSRPRCCCCPSCEQRRRYEQEQLVCHGPVEHKLSNLNGGAHFSSRKSAFPAMQAPMMMADKKLSFFWDKSIVSTALRPFSSSMGKGWPSTLWQQWTVEKHETRTRTRT